MAREQHSRNQSETQPAGDLLGDDERKTFSVNEMALNSKWLELPEYKFETFPYDGAPIKTISEEGQIVETVWRQTRAFSGGVWKFTGFWAKRNHGGQKLGFEPVAYRKIEE